MGIGLRGNRLSLSANTMRQFSQTIKSCYESCWMREHSLSSDRFHRVMQSVKDCIIMCINIYIYIYICCIQFDLQIGDLCLFFQLENCSVNQIFLLHVTSFAFGINISRANNRTLWSTPDSKPELAEMILFYAPNLNLLIYVHVYASHVNCRSQLILKYIWNVLFQMWEMENNFFCILINFRNNQIFIVTIIKKYFLRKINNKNYFIIHFSIQFYFLILFIYNTLHSSENKYHIESYFTIL